MLEIKGTYNTAKVFADIVEENAVEQIVSMCSQEAFEGSKVRIMPDVHAGKGCTIGTTMTIRDKVIPNLVGVDIGCGMEVADLGKGSVDFERLDRVIRRCVPSGFAIRQRPHRFVSNVDLRDLRCFEGIKGSEARALRSVGTLGGGNHFIEVDVNSEGGHYLVIHSGSRSLGVTVASYYQKEAHRRLSQQSKEQVRKVKDEIAERLLAEGRQTEIEGALRLVEEAPVSADFAYCEGELFEDYIHDMRLTQLYAVWNRRAMLDEIAENLGIAYRESFTTIHNYIDMDAMILRKGAVSARLGETLIIPMNMRDGSLICTGKGNPDWNFSAPHGAGRLMSRSQAMRDVTVEEFRESMAGIYTTSVGQGTLDESPMAYKPIESILSNVGDTVTVDEIVRPVYNFKASNDVPEGWKR